MSDDGSNIQTSVPDGGDLPSADTQRYYEHEGTQDLTTAIIFAVADAEGVDPSAIKSPPLYAHVDTAAVEEALFGKAHQSQNRDGKESFTFPYRGHTVTVRSDGWVLVETPAE